MQEISTTELCARLEADDSQILDLRDPDSYNGWDLDGIGRGGHLPGARNLPARWHHYLDWPEMVTRKTLNPDRPLVLYGGQELMRTAQKLSRLGFGNSFIYPDFESQWQTEVSLPLETLARYRWLVPPQWVHDPGRFGDPEPLILHAHYRNPVDYELGHIPGALAVDTNLVEDPDTWNRRSPAELEKNLCALGITTETPVVCYGRFSAPDNRDPFPGSSAGHLGAMRLAFLLLYAGVKDVRILNGGLQAWQDAGYPLETEIHATRPATAFGGRVPENPNLVVDLEEARRMLVDPGANLVCVRSRPEYLGEVSGYHYIEARGRIPGAVFGDCGSDAYHMENYRNPDHTIREAAEVARAWAASGITREKRNAFYCGTGWRGSEAFWNAWFMGWERIAVYDGGWYEWSSDPENPVETGLPR